MALSGSVQLPEHNIASVQKHPTFPLSHTSRTKKRRWPLAFRFIKGAIHHVILIPVSLHALFTALIVYLDQSLDHELGLPSSIIPSISIVVALMLVLRNGSSYERYWGGRNSLQSMVTGVRNLARSFLICGPLETEEDRMETEKVVRALVGMLYAVKNHLRSNWALSSHQQPEYNGLLPDRMMGHEYEGLSLPLELSYVIERYIKRGVDRGAFNAPQSSMLSGQINSMMDAFGSMETIKLTPIPVCLQIHQKQVLALYCCVLPFALVDDMGWWTIPIIALVCFTLYGIEGIGGELEDPFGNDRNDIRIDAIIEDCRQEIFVLIDNWKKGDEVYFH